MLVAHKGVLDLATDRSDPRDMEPSSNRLLRLAVATGLASIGLAAGGTGGALLATQLAGTDSIAGVPFALVVGGSAGGALLISWLTPRTGRPIALAAGYLTGVLGAATVVIGAMTAQLALVLAGSLLLGPANASVFLSRYGGADLAGEANRGRGMGAILFATAFGAVLAPNLLAPSGAVADALGLTPVVGLYLVSIAVFGAAGILLFRRAAPRPVPEASTETPERGPRASYAGLLVLATANLAMVGIMAVVPVHLEHHGHHLSVIGLVISIHVAGMFAPSPVTGWLSDRIGPQPLVAVAAALYLAAGTWGALASETDVRAITGFLLVLGVAWNVAVVSGSALLTAGLPAAARPSAEASGEVAMGLAAAAGATGLGISGATAGWAPTLAIGGVIGALAILAVLRRQHAPTTPADAPEPVARHAPT
jgi:Major Facilitator Superfamily